MKSTTKRVLRRIGLGLGGLLLLAGLAIGYLGFWQFDIVRDQRIPLRDGRYLVATIVKKRFGSQPQPVVLRLMPYPAVDIMGKFAAGYGGYPMVQASCRGTGRSPGPFRPFEQEGPDGYDAVEWLAKQPWCDGRVAMMGSSYDGMTQWLTAKARPPHLAAIIPAVSVAPGIDAPMARNIGSAYWLRWADYVRGRLTPAEFYDPQRAQRLYQQLYLRHFPYAQTDSLNRGRDPVFQRWMQHPTLDAYWKSVLPDSADYARLALPILSLTGYFDDDQRGALHYYRQHQRYGTAAGLRQHFLVIGPFDHRYPSGNPAASTRFGGLIMEPAAAISMGQLMLDWLDWVLKSGLKPRLLQGQANYFLMNTDQWHAAPTLAQAAPDSVAYFLTGTAFTDPRRPHLRARRLSRGAPTPASAPDSLLSDPLALPAASLRAYEKFNASPNYLTNDSLIDLPQRLAFYSPALTEAVDLVGVPQLAAYVSLSTPDADLEVSLYELDAAGHALLLSSDCLRVRYRHSAEQAELAVPGRIYRLAFGQGRFIARRLRPGSRLRLVINPLYEPGTQPNYNVGGDPGRESGRQARRGLIRIYHDAAHPSRLLLPVRRLGAKGAPRPLAKQSRSTSSE